jgi:uncharacterized protein (TIGR03083 family)
MEMQRLRECLAGDFERLTDVVAGADLDAAVPTCPDWKVRDLAAHVGAVYLHKVECIRQGVEPDPWPPAGLEDEAGRDPLGLLERAYGTLSQEFDTHRPEAPSGGWYTPDKTVGFLVRRMAQETVIHRIDAELAAGLPLAPVADDLAVDGIDEFLHIFLAYGTTAWLDWAGEVLQGTDGEGVRLSTPPPGAAPGPGDAAGSWLVRPTTEGVQVSADAGGHAKAEVSAPPADLLRWLWGRVGDDAVTITGDADRVAQLRKILTFVAQ